MERKNWSRDELVLAFNLYCKTPFGKIHGRNPDIIALAKLIDRTPSAVSWKLANFARLDPSLKARNISGASHGSKEEVEVWNEFNANWEKLGFESERLLSERKGQNLEEVAIISDIEREGKEKERTIRVRVNQNFFRATVLAAYNNRCCITGLAVPELLNAGHIIPWSEDTRNRINPRNGLCFNVLHDRAFDRGLITIMPNYKVMVSSHLKSMRNDDALKNFLLSYDEVAINMPERFAPDPAFLEYHNKNIFERNKKERL